METILTIDIGGTAIKFGVADETGRFLQKGSLPTRIREKGVDAFLADLLSLVRRVRNAFPITGIAVSLAGVVNGDTGELLLPSQFFPGLHRMNLVDFLERKQAFLLFVKMTSTARPLLNTGKALAKELICCCA